MARRTRRASRKTYSRRVSGRPRSARKFARATSKRYSRSAPTVRIELVQRSDGPGQFLAGRPGVPGLLGVSQAPAGNGKSKF